jgi:BA14K-like protein
MALHLKRFSVVMMGVALALMATGASAQPAVNLTGTYRCVQACAPGFERSTASVTQNGRDLNMVSESGIAIRAWLDWYAPTSRIWLETLHQGAVYSADGMTIQFDRGSVWERVDDPQHATIAYCARRYRSYDPATATYLGRDGRRHPCP